MIRIPRARRGLLTHDHSKQGQRYVTVLDPATLEVTVLEPFEHLIMMMCDGTRDADTISLLSGEVETVVAETLVRLERETLIEEGAPDPATIAECFEIPTGEFDAVDAPFIADEMTPLPPGLEPTVVWAVAE